MKHLLKLLAISTIVLLSGCNNEVQRTPLGWCLYEAKQEFAFDFDGQDGIVFVEEATTYFVDVQTENEVHAYLINIVHEGTPDAVISEYFAWIEIKDHLFDNAMINRKYFPESYIIDIGCELIERN